MRRQRHTSRRRSTAFTSMAKRRRAHNRVQLPRRRGKVPMGRGRKIRLRSPHVHKPANTRRRVHCAIKPRTRSRRRRPSNPRNRPLPTGISPRAGRRPLQRGSRPEPSMESRHRMGHRPLLGRAAAQYSRRHGQASKRGLQTLRNYNSGANET